MISQDDLMQAIKISQALQDYFDQNNGATRLRSTDAYDILVKTNVVERDRHSGIKFREFLKKLKNNNELNHIPQCREEGTGGKTTNWFFESAPTKTIRARNLKPVAKAGKLLSFELKEVKKKVEEFPKCDTSNFTHIENGTREKYKRAYESWTSDEDALLLQVANEITDSFKLSELFERQPSAIQRRLLEKFKIII